MLEAGLRDDSPQVRIACCESLGQRAETRSVATLAGVVRDDEDKDVRLAAVEALGNIKDPSAVAAIAVALDDRDPAMQFVGVQSMKSVTGKDYGGDVETWRQVAAGATVARAARPFDRRAHPLRDAVLIGRQPAANNSARRRAPSASTARLGKNLAATDFLYSPRLLARRTKVVARLNFGHPRPDMLLGWDGKIRSRPVTELLQRLTCWRCQQPKTTRSVWR